MHRILTTTALAATYTIAAWIAGPTQHTHALITLRLTLAQGSGV